MNKPLQPKIGHPAQTKAWLQQAQAELARTTNPRSGRAKVSQKKVTVLPWVFGLLVLQAILLVLIVLLSFPSSPEPEDKVAALDVSLYVEPNPGLSDLPPPVATPNSVEPEPLPDVVDNYLAHSVAQTSSAETPPFTENSRLVLRGMEVTQGIQVFQEPENPRCDPNPAYPDHIFCNNSMPMVSGRHTLVRVYPRCNGTCPIAETTITLRVLKEGQEQAVYTRQLLPQTVQQLTSLSMPELRLSLDNSVNFEFLPPPPWLEGDIIFELEAVAQDDTSPSRLSLAKEFVRRTPLRIAYLPIEYQGMRPPDPAEVDYWVQRLFPVPDVDYYRLPVPDVSWDGEVSKSEVLRKLLYTYWFYAQYNPASPRPDQLFGWLPKELYNGGASDPFWCPNCTGPHSSRVAFGGLRPEQDIGGPRILAHEIAHNLGAQHAWSPTKQEDTGCFKAEGVDIQVDPAWPYAKTPHIQEVGVDLYSNPPRIYPPSIYDMMAYCTQPWISPHTYRKLFDSPFLKPDAAEFLSFPNVQSQLEPNEDGTLLVSGVVYPDGTVSRPEVIKLAGDAFGDAAGFTTPQLEFIPPPGDDYCLDVHAADDSLLAQHCFDVGFTDLESGQPTEPSPFFFTLPKVNPAEVSKVSISKSKVSIIIVTPSNNAPQVTVTYPNGGEVLTGQQTITWTAFDADGDSLLYDVLYSADGGQNWLPLAIRLSKSSYTFYTHQVLDSPNTLIRVIANDGFNTTIDQSDTTFTIQPPPDNSISLVGSPTVEPGQTFQVDVVANRVTEPGLFGIQLKLDFNPVMAQAATIQANPSLNLVVDNTVNNAAGQISFIASRTGRVANLTDQITLATLTLTAGQDTGQLDLTLRDVVAGAKGGVYLPISQVQGLSVEIKRLNPLSNEN